MENPVAKEYIEIAQRIFKCDEKKQNEALYNETLKKYPSNSLLSQYLALVETDFLINKYGEEA